MVEDCLVDPSPTVEDASDAEADVGQAAGHGGEGATEMVLEEASKEVQAAETPRAEPQAEPKAAP